MVAPTNNPVVSSVPLYGPQFVIGEVTNLFQPTKLGSWDVIIPDPLIGNEPIAGYAAFTTDGFSANRGEIASTLNNFIGFFENQYFNEWDAGSLTGADTLGNKFKTSICSVGSIWVYNCTAVSTPRDQPLQVVTSITPGTTPAEIVVGAVGQFGSTPAGATLLVLQNTQVLQGNSVVGGGILVSTFSPS